MRGWRHRSGSRVQVEAGIGLEDLLVGREPDLTVIEFEVVGFLEGFHFLGLHSPHLFVADEFHDAFRLSRDAETERLGDGCFIDGFSERNCARLEHCSRPQRMKEEPLRAINWSLAA